MAEPKRTTRSKPKSKPTPPEPASPKLNSTQLRQIAEMVDGMRGMPFAACDGKRIWMSPTDPTAPGVVTIPVDANDVVPRRRSITRITITLDGGGDPPQTLELFPQTGDFPDALFWTESAVQKFMVPYYAAKHASDPHVDKVIRDLLDLFDGKKKPKGRETADGTVQVFAMAHLPKSEYTTETGPAAALNALVVLHAEDGELKMERVPAYLSPVPAPKKPAG